MVLIQRIIDPLAHVKENATGSSCGTVGICPIHGNVLLRRLWIILPRLRDDIGARLLGRRDRLLLIRSDRKLEPFLGTQSPPLIQFCMYSG